MGGLEFEETSAVIGSDPNRTDVACFVGFVRRRIAKDGVVPPPSAEVSRWLLERGYTGGAYARPGAEALLDVPVPIDGWSVFDRHFAPDRAAPEAAPAGITYLAAAVRSFFAQGGRRCYVVRAGDPWSPDAPRAARVAQLARLIPGYPNGVPATPSDPTTWGGVAHVFGLPDVSFLAMPDLADAVGADVGAPATPDPAPTGPEVFVVCTPATTAEPPRPPSFQVRRCDDAGYLTWATALRLVKEMLERHAREVHALAAVPIPAASATAGARRARAETDLLGYLEASGALADPRRDDVSFASAFVQLVYPWARTPGSDQLPEGLESPEGVLAGILAQSALSRGCFRSAMDLGAGDVFAVSPALRREQLARGPGDTRRLLLDRVSVLGPSPGGQRLLSDVTTSPDESYRPAAASRLVSAILRAARTLGEDIVFEPSSPRTWARLADGLGRVMTALWDEGALLGGSPEEAFQVRCDRTTMSQNDLDAGRAVVRLVFSAALPIDRLTVALSIAPGGNVTIASGGAA